MTETMGTIGTMGILAVIAAGWFLISIIGNWLLFKKAGKPGWHSLIPILSTWDEYDICWTGGRGILYLILIVILNAIPSNTDDMVIVAIAVVLAIWIISLSFRQSMRLARSFGKGTMYGLFLFFFDRIARIILGLGSAEYVGKDGRKDNRARLNI